MKTYSFTLQDKHLEDLINDILFLLESLNFSKEAIRCVDIAKALKYKLQQDNIIHFDQKDKIEIALINTLRVLNDLKDIQLNNGLSPDYSEQELFIFNACYDSLSEAFETLVLKSNKITLHGIKENETFNSDSFYTKKIEEINNEKDELAKEIDKIKDRLKSARNSIESITDESEKTRKELENKEQELHHSINLIKKYEAEKLQNEKINDAKTEWNGKIVAAFENLKKYIKPIKNEHSRLTFLFWGYLGISVVLIICLSIIEYIICCKIETAAVFPTWETYLSLIAPIPVAMGGLWGFITLMHRVQRQLVILAKQIHEIEYVEGLLLTTNTLSTNINESMSKVNLAIEKLLENHLKYDSSDLTEELLLEKEEKKDAMPYEEVIKLIKEVTGVVNKNKE